MELGLEYRPDQDFRLELTICYDFRGKLDRVKNPGQVEDPGLCAGTGAEIGLPGHSIECEVR